MSPHALDSVVGYTRLEEPAGVGVGVGGGDESDDPPTPSVLRGGGDGDAGELSVSTSLSILESVFDRFIVISTNTATVANATSARRMLVNDGAHPLLLGVG